MSAATSGWRGPVKAGVIGSGRIGSTVARLLAAAGSEVALANRRGPESLGAVVGELGDRVRAATVEDAARLSEMVIVAIPFAAAKTLPPAPFAGRIVVDACNYYPGRDGNIAELDRDETTSTEMLAKHLRGARVVKGLNTMYYATLAEAGDRNKPLGERLVLFVAGDDVGAKLIVSDMIEGLGFAAVDTGSLAEGGRRQQPGSSIYNLELTGAQALAILA